VSVCWCTCVCVHAWFRVSGRGRVRVWVWVYLELKWGCVREKECVCERDWVYLWENVRTCEKEKECVWERKSVFVRENKCVCKRDQVCMRERAWVWACLDGRSCMCVCRRENDKWIIYVFVVCLGLEGMGRLRSVGSIKLQVSFAEYCLFYRALLPKKLSFYRSWHPKPLHIREVGWIWRMRHVAHMKESTIHLKASRLTLGRENNERGRMGKRLMASGVQRMQGVAPKMPHGLWHGYQFWYHTHIHAHTQKQACVCTHIHTCMAIIEYHELITTNTKDMMRGGGLGSRPIFKKFNEPYAPS